jgi:hypothetical protein
MSGKRKATQGWPYFSLRRERDSNPRYSYPYNGFRDRPIQPLWHLSLTEIIVLQAILEKWIQNLDSPIFFENDILLLVECILFKDRLNS